MSDTELAYRIVMGALVGTAVVLVVSILVIGGRRLYPETAVDPERPWPDVRGYGLDVKNLVRQIEENGAAVLLTDDDLRDASQIERESAERRVRTRAYSYRRSLARVLGAPVVLTWDRDRRGVLVGTFRKETK